MPKMRSRVEYKFEETRGDGNCLFNALILGICNEDVFKHLEANLAQDKLTPDTAFADFIQQAASALGVAATWEAVKPAALKLRLTKSGSAELQEKLAPVLRHLAIKALTAETAEQYKQQEYYRNNNEEYKKYKAAKKTQPSLPHQENPFTPELQRQLVRAFNLYPKDGFDDIFKRHPFIVQKFKELKENATANPKDNIRELKKWWQQKGFQTFVDEMGKPGVFAGDNEGKRVIDYFRYLNWDVIAPGRYSSDQPTRIHSAQGKLSLPHLTYVQAQELSARDVTDGVGAEKDFDAKKPLLLKDYTEENLMVALSAVPNHAQVKAYITSNNPKKDTAIPHEWKATPDCVEQLELRGMVRDGKFAVDCSASSALKEMLQRIDEIPAKDEIIAAWKRSYRNAKTITSSNPSAVHYSNVLVCEIKAESKKAVTAVEKDKAVAAQEFFTNTLKYLTTDTAKPSEKKWQEMVEKANVEAADASIAKKVDYALANAIKLMKPHLNAKVVDSVGVTKETQEALDIELAKELQQQEYLAYQGMKRTLGG